MSTTRRRDHDGGRRIEKAHNGEGGVTGDTALFLVRCPPETPVRDLAELYQLWERDRDAFARRVAGQTELDAWCDNGDGR